MTATPKDTPAPAVMGDAPDLSVPDMPASDAAIIESCSHLTTFDDKARHIISLTRASDRAAMQAAVDAFKKIIEVDDAGDMMYRADGPAAKIARAALDALKGAE